MTTTSRLPSRLPVSGPTEISMVQRTTTIPTSQGSSNIRTNLKPPSAVTRPASTNSQLPQPIIQINVESPLSNRSSSNIHLGQPLKAKNDATNKIITIKSTKSPSARRKSNSLYARTENVQLRVELEKLKTENERLQVEMKELVQEKDRDRAHYQNELETANKLMAEQSVTMNDQQTLIEELMAQIDEQERVCQDLQIVMDTFKANQNTSA